MSQGEAIAARYARLRYQQQSVHAAGVARLSEEPWLLRMEVGKWLHLAFSKAIHTRARMKEQTRFADVSSFGLVVRGFIQQQRLRSLRQQRLGQHVDDSDLGDCIAMAAAGGAYKHPSSPLNPPNNNRRPDMTVI